MATQRLDTETRQIQIKKAVLEIISEDGLAKLTTRNLAKKVGVSEGAIFRHFKNKNEIILSIVEDVKTQLIQRQKVIAYGNKSAKERLFEFLCKHVQYLVENKGITILLFSEAAYFNETELKSELSRIMIEQKKYLIKIVKDGMEEGIWDSEIKVDNFSALYLGIPISLNVEMILNSSNFHRKDFCKNMICLLERILEKK
ncbi:MAG: TetR/AcrR family transcriptional regulator [Chlorobi bacterium]|nr:TetR/AcrR family transcriptional regulator [Chlorobiota bacterium]